MVGFGDKLQPRIIPEWRTKYVRYVRLAAILDRLPIVENSSIRSPDCEEKTRYNLKFDHLYYSTDPEGKAQWREVNCSRFQSPDDHQHLSNPELDSLSRRVTSFESKARTNEFSFTPFKAKILVTTRHGDDVILDVDCWRFDLDPACISGNTDHRDFLNMLNEDISTLVDFQARILCQCLAERDILQARQQTIVLDHPSSKVPGLPVRGIFEKAAGVLETQRLLHAYEQLYKLTKYLGSYMEVNREALDKILKKHAKHSRYGNLDVLFKAICSGAVSFPAEFHSDQHLSDHTPNVPLCLNKDFLQRELVHAVEQSYVDLMRFHDKLASRQSALAKLRRAAGLEKHPDTHHDTLLVGLFVGMSFPLVFYSVVVVIGDRDIHGIPLWPVGWIYFRMCFLVAWQLGLWAVNLHLFEVLRINHVLIFDLAPHSAMRPNTAFLAAALTFLATFLAFTLFLVNLTTVAASGDDPETAAAQLGAFAWAGGRAAFFWPNVLLAAVGTAALLPLPLACWRTRAWLLRQLGRMALVPLRPADWPLFFLADQLCSHVRTLHDLLLLACLATTGPREEAQLEREDDSDACLSPRGLRTIAFISGLLPPAIRAVQCARRYCDMRRQAPGARNMHHVNLLKYVSSMLVVAASAFGSRETWVVLAVAATVGATYWDTVEDWGMGSRRWAELREGLLARAPLVGRGVYCWAVVSNAVMRCAWVLSISPGSLGIALPQDVLAFVLALVELLRRAQWNVLRLEWEQHHNTGEWRAVKAVHLELSESLLAHPVTLVASACAALHHRSSATAGLPLMRPLRSRASVKSNVLKTLPDICVQRAREDDRLPMLQTDGFDGTVENDGKGNMAELEVEPSGDPSVAEAQSTLAGLDGPGRWARDCASD